MKPKLLVWRESVYKNDFRCNKCNKKFDFNPQTGVAKDLKEQKLGFRTWLLCPLCGNPVAYTEKLPKDMKDLEPGLHGNIEDWGKK